jgi:hypothetical protein
MVPTSPLGWETVMPVVEYLAQARACAGLADRARDSEDRKKILAIAKAWAELAKTAAERGAAKPDDKAK